MCTLLIGLCVMPCREIYRKKNVVQKTGSGCETVCLGNLCHRKEVEMLYPTLLYTCVYQDVCAS